MTMKKPLRLGAVLVQGLGLAACEGMSDTQRSTATGAGRRWALSASISRKGAMSFAVERRALQVCVALGGLVAVAAGFQGLMVGLGEPGGFADSHFRYLSGLLLGVGASFWGTIPDIERRGAIFRIGRNHQRG